MLVLFDIDGTLLRTRGAGVASMEVAGRALFGDSFSMEGVTFAGRLDPLIWRDAADRNGIDRPAEREPAFRAAYVQAFRAAFDEGAATVRVLPGVLDLLAALAGAGVPVGIVTGNYPETGGIKLNEAGLDARRFVAAAWGDDGADRRALPPVAMTRFAQVPDGRRIDPADVVVIGDTPHDVDCARHAGCRPIAVATGPAHDRATLAGHEPDLALDDLADTQEVMRWIMG